MASLATEQATLAPGTVLQDRYQILRLRALGGMSNVYEAVDLRFSRTRRRCAIKEVLNIGPDDRTRTVNLQAFEREANIIAALSHPAIPAIFDYFHEDDRAYLVLEYVDGEDLETLLEHTPGFLPERQVLDWALQVCDVLDYLHNHEGGPIIFRDIKPSNIMLRPDGRIMLVDFGIAKVFVSRRGTMVGTEGYSPPEQYRGLAGPQGDIYALGATLHHLLTRQDPRQEPPFSFAERPPRAANPAISPETEALIMRALEYEPEKRFASAAEMKETIAAILGRSTAPVSGNLALALKGRTISPAWEFACEDEVRSSPVLFEHILYVGSYDHHLYALEGASGRLLWKYRTDAGICASPCVNGDKVFIGSEDRVFYALSRRTGRIVWSCPTDGKIRSTALAAYGHVFFGSDDGHLYAVNADSGRVIWKFRAGGPIRCRPLLVDETIVIGCEDGVIYGLHMGNGEIRWRQRTGHGLVSSPCFANGLIYIGSRDWHLYALSAHSGWPVWRFRTNNWVISSPAVAEGRVFFGSVDGNVYALEAAKGQQIWRYATEGQVTSSPAVEGGAVYIGSTDSHLYCLDAKSGELRWRFRTGGPMPASPCVADGLVYTGSLDGRVYALPLQ